MFSASRVFKAHLELFVLGSVVFRVFHLGPAGPRIITNSVERVTHMQLVYTL